MLVGITSGIEKSKAGESIPCPKLVAMILEKHVQKDKRRPRSVVKSLVKNQYYFFFLCQKTMEVVNPENPMVLELDREWLKKMAPFIKASIIAITLASHVTAGISLLPFHLGLDDIKNTFDGIYRDVMANDDFADPKTLEKTIKSLEDWTDHKTEQVSLTDGQVTQIKSLDNHQVTQVKKLTGMSYRFFSEKALKEKNLAFWKPYLKVDVHEGRVAWVVKSWTRR